MSGTAALQLASSQGAQERPTASDEARQVLIETVLDVLVTQGYDAVTTRDISRRSRMSSKTIYKLFQSREHLIVAALETWMVANVYVNIAMPEPGETLYQVHMKFMRAMFEPWEQNPRILEAYHRALSGPAGASLRAQGTTVARDVGEAVLLDDPAFARDLEAIMVNVFTGLVSRFVQGAIGVEEIMPGIEVATARLTGTPSENREGAVDLNQTASVEGPR